VHSLAQRWRLALRYLDEAQARLSRGDGPLFEWIPEDRALALLALNRRREALTAVRWGLRRRPRAVRLRALRVELEMGRVLTLRPGKPRPMQSPPPRRVRPGGCPAGPAKEDCDDDRDP